MEVVLVQAKQLSHAGSATLAPIRKVDSLSVVEDTGTANLPGKTQEKHGTSVAVGKDTGYNRSQIAAGTATTAY